MRLTSIGKAKAVQCYVSLLIWLVLVSIGLYWYLNNKTGSGLTALTQSGFGYNDISNYNDATGTGTGHESSDKSIGTSYTNRLDSNNNNNHAVKDGSIDSNLQLGMKAQFLAQKEAKHFSNNFFHKQTLDTERETTGESDFSNLEKNPYSTVRRLCNPVESIKAGDENVQVPDFKLEAVVVVIRHGDRGPLTHIGQRNVSHIKCGASSPDLAHLVKFATETLAKLPGYSQFIGPFHTFPKVPMSHHCSLGQLSQVGSVQLLTLGKMIRSTYRSTLANFTSLSGSNTGNVLTPHPLKVTAYSTRYRRTFQSLFAFLFGLLGPKHLVQSTTIKESQSITFCFNDCSCRTADRLKKAAAKKYKPTRTGKLAMATLVNHLNSVLGLDRSKKTGNSLLDSLLVYPCHKMELPCREDNQKDKGVKLIYNAIKKLSHQNSVSDTSCVNLGNLAQLVSRIQKESFELKEVAESRNYHLLSSFGLLKEILNLALKMTSSSSHETSRKQQFQQSAGAFSMSSSMSANGNYHGKGVDSKTKIVIFSGHDTTLQSLTAALGIFSGHPDIQLPPFSSRLIFEFYRRTNIPPNSPRKHYFRVIYNGISVTHLVSFCKDSYTTTNINRLNETAKEDTARKSKYYFKTFFCPIENLVRFIHEHYFDSFQNATNFKDACQI